MKPKAYNVPKTLNSILENSVMQEYTSDDPNLAHLKLTTTVPFYLPFPKLPNQVGETLMFVFIFEFVFLELENVTHKKYKHIKHYFFKLKRRIFQ